MVINFGSIVRFVQVVFAAQMRDGSSGENARAKRCMPRMPG